MKYRVTDGLQESGDYKNTQKVTVLELVVHLDNCGSFKQDADPEKPRPELINAGRAVLEGYTEFHTNTFSFPK